jgi:phytoene synthase
MNPLLPAHFPDAATLLRRSGSSFAAAIRLLPREPRRDLSTLYAICRTLDDIADADNLDHPQRLAAWHAWCDVFAEDHNGPMPPAVRDLVNRRKLDRGLFIELLEGVAIDLHPPVTMPDRAALDRYCHQVAGTVGRLCLPIFGTRSEQSIAYAETLGRALQYTNILRDTAVDLTRQRVYYPIDELKFAALDPTHLDHSSWQKYLRQFAVDTEQLYLDAASLLPAEDRPALRPARLMAAHYQALLQKIIRNDCRVFDRHFRLSSAEKILVLLRHITRRY